MQKQKSVVDKMDGILEILKQLQDAGIIQKHEIPEYIKNSLPQEEKDWVDEFRDKVRSLISKNE